MTAQYVNIKLNDGTEYGCYRYAGSPWAAVLPSLVAHFDCSEDDLGTHETFDAEENCTEVITLNGEVVGKFVRY